MLDMVEKSGSAVGRDSTRAAVNDLSRSRADTQMAFQSANIRFKQSIEATFIVMDEQPKLDERHVFIKNQENDRVYEIMVTKN